MSHQVIVVEDSEELRYAYSKLLESEGYTVRKFPNYHDVVELLDTGWGEILIVDIVLDAGTPHGVALAAMAQMHRPGLPVVFVTGYLEYARHVPPGALVLSKPVAAEVLLRTVRDALSQPRSPRG